MSIAKLRLDETTKLEFGVSITGATGQPETRLVIEGKNFSIVYPCKPTNEGVEVKINELKNILPAGTYPVKLEVVVENKIYIPFEDNITLEPPIEVSSKSKAAVVEIKESIKVDKVVVKEHSSPSQDRMKVAAVIAQLTGYKPNLEESPQSIIENSMMRSNTVRGSAIHVLNEMVKLAREVGLIVE